MKHLHIAVFTKDNKSKQYPGVVNESVWVQGTYNFQYLPFLLQYLEPHLNGTISNPALQEFLRILPALVKDQTRQGTQHRNKGLIWEPTVLRSPIYHICHYGHKPSEAGAAATSRKFYEDIGLNTNAPSTLRATALTHLHGHVITSHYQHTHLLPFSLQPKENMVEEPFTCGLRYCQESKWAGLVLPMIFRCS
jgi:hypothetical protein